KGDSIKRDGTLYVLAVGVNRYRSDGYNLNYAVADVEGIGAELDKQQAKLKQYAHTEVIPLKDEQATKANLLLALSRFAGVDNVTLPENAPTDLRRIKQVQPEDAIVIYFAGHGTARDERFYLLAH